MNIHQLLFLILFIIPSSLGINVIAKAEEIFFEDKARGWYWYEDPKDKKEQTKTEKQDLKITPVINHNQIMENLQERVKTSLNRAILVPKKENIIEYIKLQEMMMDRSELFAKNWQKIRYTNPEFDRNVNHPVTQAALPVYYAENNARKKIKIQELSGQYGLIYFYKGSCKFCQAFTPVIQDFAKRYNWEILAVSMDGIIIPEFPNSRTDNGTASKLSINVVPAVIAVNTTNNQAIPIAYGFISQNEMEERIDLLVQTEQGKQGGIK